MKTHMGDNRFPFAGGEVPPHHVWYMPFCQNACYLRSTTLDWTFVTCKRCLSKRPKKKDGKSE